jgi:Putative Ig domain
LLFILLLAMVIMALLPKAANYDQVENQGRPAAPEDSARALEIATPTCLPDALVGRRYTIALAATGAKGPLHWSVGMLPEWLTLDAQSGQLSGTPPKPEDQAFEIPLRVTDGTQHASRTTRLLVLPAPTSASAGSWWKPRWAAVPWGAWLEQGVGFLVLWLVHLFGMNVLVNLEHRVLDGTLVAEGASGQVTVRKRFASYRLFVRVATLSATIALVLYLASVGRR